MNFFTKPVHKFWTLLVALFGVGLRDLVVHFAHHAAEIMAVGILSKNFAQF